MPDRILIVEDDPNLVLTLRDVLTQEGYRVESAIDGNTAVKTASDGGFDLVLLDVVLPGQDGFAVCAELRQSGINTPILLLTARAGTLDKVLGLRLGADDYVTKPFDVRELLARIQALLRRARSEGVASLNKYEFGRISVDFLKARVARDGRPIGLSWKELHLLRYLIARRGAILSREELLSEVWGYRSTSTRTVDMHVANLRHKLEDDPEEPHYIVTVRGQGYMFRG